MRTEAGLGRLGGSRSAVDGRARGLAEAARPRRAVIVVALTLTLALVGAGGSCPSAHAASTWLPAQQIDRTGGVITDVSCASTGFCLADGEDGAFLQQAGQRPDIETALEAAGEGEEMRKVSTSELVP